MSVSMVLVPTGSFVTSEAGEHRREKMLAYGSGLYYFHSCMERVTLPTSEWSQQRLVNAVSFPLPAYYRLWARVWEIAGPTQASGAQSFLNSAAQDQTFKHRKPFILQP